MNPPEDQSETKLAARYFDPEAIDMSEQQFSASLDGAIERPRFELDSSAEQALEQNGLQPPAIDEPGTVPRSSSLEDEQPAQASTPATVAPDWREEVSAKVNRYKMRRPRQERYPSLQLQFDAYREQKSVRAAHTALFDSPAVETSELAPLVPPPQIALEATARVLEFPRAVVPPDWADQLAEPVIDRPRIVEAPELLPPPPAMGGILIEPPPQPEPERRPGIDVPLQSATLERRLWAAAIDLVIVALAVGIFGYLLIRIAGSLPPLKLSSEIVAALLLVLWPAYQYAFLVFAGATPGLRLTRLSIRHFDGTPASRNVRRWRALASILSGISLGLGYAWCFLDEDQLSWHDRITRTHLAPRRTPIASVKLP